MNTEKLLSISEASALLCLSKSKIYALCEQKSIEQSRFDGRILFSFEQLKKFAQRLVVEVGGKQ